MGIFTFLALLLKGNLKLHYIKFKIKQMSPLQRMIFLPKYIILLAKKIYPNMRAYVFFGEG